MADPQILPPSLPPMRQGHYVPKEGEETTITLPGEKTRATILRVISDIAIIAELTRFTTSKDHNYKKGDYVPCRYMRDTLNQNGWVAVDERELTPQTTEWPEAIPEPVLEAPVPERGALNIEVVESDYKPEE